MVRCFKLGSHDKQATPKSSAKTNSNHNISTFWPHFSIEHSLAVSKLLDRAIICH
jgi:hypothetical protein